METRKMNYLARINSEEFSKLKENHGDLTIKFRMNMWVKHLANPKNFKKFFKDLGKEKNSLDNVTDFVIRDMNKADWNKFVSNCNEMDSYGSNAINYLVKEYNAKGRLFVVEIAV
jgi:pyruvate formate-lyase activating enzyme-like uncharacterized protein